MKKKWWIYAWQPFLNADSKRGWVDNIFSHFLCSLRKPWHSRPEKSYYDIFHKFPFSHLHLYLNLCNMMFYEVLKQHDTLSGSKWLLFCATTMLKASAFFRINMRKLQAAWNLRGALKSFLNWYLARLYMYINLNLCIINYRNDEWIISRL